MTSSRRSTDRVRPIQRVDRLVLLDDFDFTLRVRLLKTELRSSDLTGDLVHGPGKPSIVAVRREAFARLKTRRHPDT